MDTCVIINVSTRGIALCGCLCALVDFLRRDIPAVIGKFRALATAFMVVDIVQEVSQHYSFTPGDSTTAKAEGALSCLRDAILWPLCLYFLQNFVQVFADLGLGKKTQALSKIMTTWIFARVAIFVVFVAMAIAFVFDPTNRVMLARRAIMLLLFVLVLLPISVTCVFVFRSVGEVRAALEAQNASSGSALAQADTALERVHALKVTQRKLLAFAIVLGVICLAGVAVIVPQMIDFAEHLDEPWTTDECSIGSAFYGAAFALLVALYLTRHPNAKRRDRHSMSSTRKSTSDIVLQRRRSSTKGASLPKLIQTLERGNSKDGSAEMHRNNSRNSMRRGSSLRSFQTSDRDRGNSKDGSAETPREHRNSTKRGSSLRNVATRERAYSREAADGSFPTRERAYSREAAEGSIEAQLERGSNHSGNQS